MSADAAAASEDALRDRFGAALARLVSAVGSPLIRAEAITAAPDGGPRQTYRLWFADGRTLKGRRFGSVARAETTHRILASVPFLGRVVAHDGDAMLEEWIDGEPLVEENVDPRHLCEAGRMLGRLHGWPLPPGGLDVHALDGPAWARMAVNSLRVLGDEDLIVPEAADVLGQLVMAHVPATVAMGLVHRDLCPENLIVEASGRLVSVDNAAVTIGAIAYDLARVWYRWPMSPDEQSAFNAGYREFRGGDALRTPSVFWAIVVVVNSARVRLGVSAAAAASALGRLDAYFSEQSFDWRAGGRVRTSR